jgi:hypothetical protein
MGAQGGSPEKILGIGCTGRRDGRHPQGSARIDRARSAARALKRQGQARENGHPL